MVLSSVFKSLNLNVVVFFKFLILVTTVEIDVCSLLFLKPGLILFTVDLS